MLGSSSCGHRVTVKVSWVTSFCRTFSRLGKLAGIKEPVEPKEQDTSSKGRKDPPTAARTKKQVANQRKVFGRLPDIC